MQPSKRRLVDLSVTLDNNPYTDPPPLLPKIDYMDHQQGWPEMAAMFPGLSKDQLPGDESWAAERLKATAWLDPVGERFQRIDYSLPKPVKGPSGGKLTRYEQSYELKTEPRWGFSYVSGFTIDLEARAAFKRIERRFEAKVTDVYFFFASTDAEAAYDARRAEALQMASGPTSPGR